MRDLGLATELADAIDARDAAIEYEEECVARTKLAVRLRSGAWVAYYKALDKFERGC